MVSHFSPVPRRPLPYREQGAGGVGGGPGLPAFHARRPGDHFGRLPRSPPRRRRTDQDAGSVGEALDRPVVHPARRVPGERRGDSAQPADRAPGVPAVRLGATGRLLARLIRPHRADAADPATVRDRFVRLHPRQRRRDRSAGSGVRLGGSRRQRSLGHPPVARLLQRGGPRVLAGMARTDSARARSGPRGRAGT